MSEQSLRQRFLTLRREEARSAPMYAALEARAESARATESDRRRWRLAATAALAALVLLCLPPLVAHMRHGSPARPRPALAPGHWAMPTDVLLELPGSALLRSVPRIGEPEAPMSEPKRSLG